MSLENLAGKRILVMGLGRFGGGIGVTRFLVSQGAVVTVNDADPAEKLRASVEALADIRERITFKLGGHDPADFVTQDAIVVNPAVDRLASPAVQAANDAGVTLTTEMNLFLERCPSGNTIGITGSVGKSTTTMLIFEALRAAAGEGMDPERKAGAKLGRVFLGGNIGKSLLLELSNIRPEDWVVLELSSFMLEEVPAANGGQGWSPHVAVVTNIFPNHLDRHKTMANLTAAKQNILRFQKLGDVAILNGDHDLAARWAHLAKGRVVKFTTKGPARLGPLMVPGEHNRSNAAAALAVVDAVLGEGAAMDRAAALRAIAEFRGLDHRLQLVHTCTLADGGTDPGPKAGAKLGAKRRELRFYNDSKATTPEASITALEAFEPKIAIFIVGGYDKHADMSAFVELLAKRAAGVLTIGQTGLALARQVQEAAGAPRTEYVETLPNAVARAIAWAQADANIEAVVLSPACASYGQFANYEERGELFIALARAADGTNSGA